MRRDIANEIVVAIVAVAVIAFALTFGILLSLSSTPGPQATSAAGEASPDVTMSAASSPTIMPTASATPTERETIFTLLAPTRTPTLTFTATAAPPTPTPSLTATQAATVSLLNAATRAPSATTDARVTVTVSPPVTAMPTLSPTVKASAEPSPSLTPSASATFTATATASASKTAVPTFTASATRTLTRTATVTPSATATPASTLAATVTATLTRLARPAGTVTGPCEPALSWARYIVMTGDTLARLADQVGATEEALRAGNCLSSEAAPIVGDLLLLPRLPVVPTPSSGFPAPALRAYGCHDEDFASITNFFPGQRLSGVFVVIGSAALDAGEFPEYIVQLRADDALKFADAARGSRAVRAGELARLNTEDFEDGIVWIRLIVRGADGLPAPLGICVYPVVFD